MITPHYSSVSCNAFVIVTYPAAPECNVCEREVYEALRWNHVKLSERLLISPVPAPQLTRACVRALKIHELGEALLSCVTLLEIAWRVERGERVDVGSGWICEWEVGGNTEREGKGEREQAYIKHGREGQGRAKIETKDSERASGLFEFFLFQSGLMAAAKTHTNTQTHTGCLDQTTRCEALTNQLDTNST